MQIADTFSQPTEIYLACIAEHPQVKLYELQTLYNTEDLFDILEMIDVYQASLEESNKAVEAKMK